MHIKKHIVNKWSIFSAVSGWSSGQESRRWAKGWIRIRVRFTVLAASFTPSTPSIASFFFWNNSEPDCKTPFWIRTPNYQVTRQFGCRNDGYDHFSGVWHMMTMIILLKRMRWREGLGRRGQFGRGWGLGPGGAWDEDWDEEEGWGQEEDQCQGKSGVYEPWQWWRFRCAQRCAAETPPCCPARSRRFPGGWKSAPFQCFASLRPGEAASCRIRPLPLRLKRTDRYIRISSKRTFSQAFKEKCTSELLRISSVIIFSSFIWVSYVATNAFNERILTKVSRLSIMFLGYMLKFTKLKVNTSYENSPSICHFVQ